MKNDIDVTRAAHLVIEVSERDGNVVTSRDQFRTFKVWSSAEAARAGVQVTVNKAISNPTRDVVLTVYDHLDEKPSGFSIFNGQRGVRFAEDLDADGIPRGRRFFRAN